MVMGLREFKFEEAGETYEVGIARHAALEAARNFVDPSEGEEEIRLLDEDNGVAHVYEVRTKEPVDKSRDRPEYFDEDLAEVQYIQKQGIEIIEDDSENSDGWLGLPSLY